LTENQLIKHSKSDEFDYHITANTSIGNLVLVAYLKDRKCQMLITLRCQQQMLAKHVGVTVKQHKKTTNHEEREWGTSSAGAQNSEALSVSLILPSEGVLVSEL
jgi:hypothetical protein